MTFFKLGRVEHGDQALELAPAELEPLVTRGDYWHSEGSPSTWLAVSVFHAAKAKFPKAPQEVLLLLASQALGITPEGLRGLIAWHESYMRWHDGDQTYTVL